MKTFSRFIILQEKREISIREVLKYELGALPLSIACSDGGMVKSVKAKLGNELKKFTPVATSLPVDCALIFDGMVLLHKVPKHCSTFGEISDFLLFKLLSSTSKIVFFVTDRYLENSTKSLERKGRNTSGTIRYEVRRREQAKPKQYDKFLRNPENKLSLIRFLLDDWKKKPPTILQGKEIYATLDDKGYHIFEKNGIVIMEDSPDISSEQEEADTKMFLCAKYAPTIGASSVCINTIDTDVLILALYYSSQRNEHFSTLDVPVFINLLGKSEDQLLNVTNADIDIELRRGLPGLHAVTGCDAVSAFFRRGKIKALRILQSQVTNLLNFCVEFLK